MQDFILIWQSFYETHIDILLTNIEWASYVNDWKKIYLEIWIFTLHGKL